MSKKSCEAAESIEDALLRMARVNWRRYPECTVRQFEICRLRDLPHALESRIRDSSLF